MLHALHMLMGVIPTTATVCSTSQRKDQRLERLACLPKVTQLVKRQVGPVGPHEQVHSGGEEGGLEATPREEEQTDSSTLFIRHRLPCRCLLAFVPAEAVSLPNPGRKKPGAGSWGQSLGDIGSGYFSLNSGERPN